MKKIYLNGITPVSVLAASGTIEEIKGQLIAEFAKLLDTLECYEDIVENRRYKRKDLYYTWIELRDNISGNSNIQKP